MQYGKKVKPGQIKFIPQDNRLLAIPPFVNAASKPPSWFKKIGKQKGSLRTCAGTVDYLALGVTLTMWTNYYFRPNPHSGFWESRGDDFSGLAGGINKMEGFSFESTGSCPVTQNRQLEVMQYPKMVNPWHVETAPGWSTIMLPHHWEPNPDYDVLPAIVHTDFYHMVNVVINIKTNTDFSIRAGTPIAQLIPFKRSGDFEEIIYEDESMFKYFSKGFGMGHLAPSGGTAGPYRRERNKVDQQIREQEDSSGLLRNLFKRDK
jgi:hypothetical protein